MAFTYNIACHDCAVSLWIGQCRSREDLSCGYLYTTESARKFQRDFFFAHTGHRLEFNMSEHFDVQYDFREISTEPADEE
jgi:hypothetical protein